MGGGESLGVEMGVGVGWGGKFTCQDAGRGLSGGQRRFNPGLGFSDKGVG